MNRLRWTALCICTIVFVWISWAGLPPRLPLVPDTNLNSGVDAVILLHQPKRTFMRLENTALAAGLFDDNTQPPDELSPEGLNARLPPLVAPFQAPAQRREQVRLALEWLQPRDLALIQITRGGRIETWVGVQGGRTRTAGWIASWFVANLSVAGNVWFRVENRAASSGMPAPTVALPMAPIPDHDADLLLLLPHGLAPLQPPLAPTGDGPTPTDRIAALCRAAGLPGQVQQIQASLWLKPDRLRWHIHVSSQPEPLLSNGNAAANPPATPHLPDPNHPGVFLTFYSRLDWPRLYHELLAGLSEPARADFLRSMRYYRLVQKGYSDPENALIDPLGCGVALVGRRGPRYGGKEIMPSLQAEIPLRASSGSLLTLLQESPNRRFRQMMPDFAEARFDKIRVVGETAYTVHPSYVAVTPGDEFDQYVLIRPSIAGSALLPSWRVDETRIKIGTRPDVLEYADLFTIPGAGEEPVPLTLQNQNTPVLELYLDPSAITDQLDKFRILLKVEAGADRPMPDEGLTLERMEIENEKIARRTAQNMKIAAQVGWVLKRLGPLALKIQSVPQKSGTAVPVEIEIRGMLELKARP